MNRQCGRSVAGARRAQGADEESTVRVRLATRTELLYPTSQAAAVLGKVTLQSETALK